MDPPNTTARSSTQAHFSTSPTKPNFSTSVHEASEVTSTSPSPHPDPSFSLNAAHAMRLACRNGKFASPTSGYAAGHIQANLLILPLSAAPSFFALCQRNPVPCPLLAYSKPGSATEFISNLLGLTGEEIVGKDFDVRTDAPEYYLYENGVSFYEAQEVKKWFKSNGTHSSMEQHVAFLIGCSFSFERALADAGLPPRHWSTPSDHRFGKNCPTYQTTVPLLPAGIFANAGCMVVSMRPYQEKDIERVRQITAQFGSMHGEPVAWGWNAVAKLGIKDICNVDFGGPTEVSFEDGEVPVFWGCGVTPQIVVMDAGDAIEGVVIGHNPGHLLVLDLTEEMALAAEKKMGVEYA